MKLSINGKIEETDSGINISRLLELKKIRPEVVTVELNGEIINRARYGEIDLKDGDKLEFVYYMGGGSTRPFDSLRSLRDSLTTGGSTSPAVLSVVEGLTTSGFKNGYYVYIVKCKNGAFYTGITNNLAKRLETHAMGKGSLYTKYNSPVRIVHKEKFENITGARKREIQLKGWTRRKKEALSKGDLRLLKLL